MSKFEINYEHEIDYNQKIDLEIRLAVKPNTVDYQAMLDAIDLLDKIAQKYLSPKSSATKVK